MNEITQHIDSMRCNISELKKNISLYAAQLNTIEAIWDNVPALMFYKDKCNNLIRVNNFFCSVMNCRREDVEGKNIKELSKTEVQAAQYADNDWQVLRSGVPKLGILETLFDTGIRLRTDKFPIIVNDKAEGVLGIAVIINTET
jgi:PAS domain-containing protein